MASLANTDLTQNLQHNDLVDDLNSSRQNNKCVRAEEENVRYFTQAELIEQIIESLREESDNPDSIVTNKEKFSTKLNSLFNERFKEISAVETLQKLQAPFAVEQPKTSYEDSNLRYDEYIRDNFERSVNRGFLPLSEVDDKKLRRRISVEKSRGNFPKELDNVCLTQNEVAQARRDAFALIAGFLDTKSQRFAAFARQLVPAGFR